MLELSHADQSKPFDPANGMSAWIDALVNKFKRSGTLLLQKLHTVNLFYKKSGYRVSRLIRSHSLGFGNVIH